jgi:phospholipid/cholesterol/gamma-HCH transport system substrate-binding protein
MGSKGINLKIGNSNNMLSNGDTIISKIEKDLKEQVSAQMLPLKIKAEDLMVSIEDAIKVVRNIFNKTNTDNIENTLRNLNKTFTTLKHTSTELDSILTNSRGKLDRIFSNVSSITTNLRNNNEQITFILKNLATVSDSLAKSKLLSTINNANRTLAQTDSIMRKINSGEGTIGQLVNNDTLYQNLETASRNLDLLLIDIRENPKRYIHYSLFDFGKTIVVNNKDDLKKKKGKQKNKDLSYSIQIKSATKRIPFNSKELKNVKNISEHYIDGYYKYSIGNSSNYTEMKALRNEILKLFPDAFITKYTNDSIIKESY